MIKLRQTDKQIVTCNCGTANTLAVNEGKWKIMNVSSDRWEEKI